MENQTATSLINQAHICNVLKIADVDILYVSEATRAFFKSEKLAEYVDVTPNQEHIYNIGFILDSITNPAEEEFTQPMPEEVLNELTNLRRLAEGAYCSYLRIV